MSTSKPTIGFKYYLGMHMVICHGPVDEILKIYAGERVAYTPSPGNPIDSSTAIYIRKPNLFGGKKKEGGIEGIVDVMFGEDTQLPNAYLDSNGQVLQSGWRGVTGVVLRQVYITAMTPYIKPWWFEVKYIPGKDWYPEKAEINGASNGIHIIYEAWTNEDWGMGYPPATIDDANWREAADLIYDQGLSLSLIYAQASSIEEFIFQILSHLNGISYSDYRTGLQRIKIFADDYDKEGTFVELDKTNIKELVAYGRPGYGEVINEVTVVYRKQGEPEDSSVTVQDLAVINAQEGITSQTIQYPGIDTDENAALVAERDLKQLSTPLAKITLVVNREGFSLRQGDIFKFSWENLNITGMFCRVIGIDFGSLSDRTVKIDAVEDIFGIGQTSYIDPQDSLWDDPYVEAVPLIDYRLMDIPYYFLTQELGESAINDVPNTSAYAMAFGAKPPIGSNTGHVLFGASTPDGWADEELESIDLASNAATLRPLADMLPADATFYYDPNTSIDPQTIALSDFVMIGDEFIFIEDIDHNTQLVTVKRGVLDTIPAFHSAQTIGFLVNSETYTFDPEEHFLDETYYYWVNGRSLIGFDIPSSDATDSVDFTARQGKPYPPADVKFNGDYFPTELRSDFTITWSGRNRTLSTAPGSAVGWFEGPQRPEPGTTYNIEVFDASVIPAVLIETFYGLEVDAITNIGTFRYRATDTVSTSYTVRISALRKGLISEQRVSHTFDIIGYGINYGFNYGGNENGEILEPGAIAPPSGNVVPLPAPEWVDGRWRGITSSSGIDEPSGANINFTWDGGTSAQNWSVVQVTDADTANPKHYTEYGNDIYIDQNVSSLVYYIRRGSSDWETLNIGDISGLFTSGGFKECISFNDDDNVFLISINNGRDIVTTSDFLNFTVHAVGSAPNPVSSLMEVVGVLWNGSQYVASGIIPGSFVFDPISGENKPKYQLAYTVGSDLLNWVLGDEVNESVAFAFTKPTLTAAYFGTRWYAYGNSVAYFSLDLKTWTDISADVGYSTNEEVEEVVVRTGSLAVICTSKVYLTSSGTSYSENVFRFNNVNDFESPVRPFRGKQILMDTRDAGPSSVTFRTASNESVGGKILGLDSLSATPSAVATLYPPTLAYENKVGIISRNNSSINGVNDTSMTINGIDGEGFANAAVPSTRTYWEVEVIDSDVADLANSVVDAFQIGIRTRGGLGQSLMVYVTSRSRIISPEFQASGGSLPIAISVGDVFGIEYDDSNDRIIFYQNGVEFYRYESGINAGGNVYPYFNADLATLRVNVGQEAFENQPLGTQSLW